MPGRFRDESTKKPSLDKIIKDLCDEMNKVGVYSDMYPALLAYLERLYILQTNERPNKVSRDTLAVVAGNLFGILVIVAYEQKHVMTSKGFSQLIRPK